MSGGERLGMEAGNLLLGLCETCLFSWCVPVELICTRSDCDVKVKCSFLYSFL